MKIFSVNIDAKDVDALDELSSGPHMLYPSRSEAVRAAIRTFIQAYLQEIVEQKRDAHRTQLIEAKREKIDREVQQAAQKHQRLVLSKAEFYAQLEGGVLK